MTSNFRFVYFVTWTAALVCLTCGAPLREESILDRFVNSFGKECHVLSYIILPRYKLSAGTYDLQNYNLSVPLEACSTADQSDPAVPICKEAFQLIYNLSTCRPDIETLKDAVPSIAPINISVEIDNVCEGFFANQSLFTHSEESIAFSLADKKICPLICKEKITKACSFLLWGYQVQASISDTLERALSANKALSGSENEEAVVEKDAENETLEKGNGAVSSVKVPEVTSQKEKSSAGTPVSKFPNSDEGKQKEVKSAITQKSADSKSFKDKSSLDVDQESPASQKPMPEAKPNDPKSSTKTSENAASISEKTTIVVSSKVSKITDSSSNVPLVHSSSDGTDKKDQSDISVTEKLRKNAARLPQAKLHTDKPSKDSGAEVSSDSSNTAEKGKGEKIDVPSQSANMFGHGSNVDPYLTENSETDPVGSQGDITENKNPVDNTVKAKENEVQEDADSPLISENNPKSDTPAEDTLEKASHPVKSTKNAKETSPVPEPEIPSPEAALQSMDDAKDEKSLPADDDEDFINGRFDGETGESDFDDENLPDNKPSQLVDTKEESDVQNSELLTNSAAKSIGKNVIPAVFPEQEDTHFFFYFITIIIFAIGGYVLFHNKQKIFALIIEGRHERRRRSGASYKKLETK